MSRRPYLIAVAFLLLVASLPLAGCGSTESVTAESMMKAAAAAGSANGLCPIMDRLVTRDGGSADYKGQKIAFCCPGCVTSFRKDPEKWIGLMKASPAKYGYKP